MDTYLILPATLIITTGLFQVTSVQLLSTHRTVLLTPAPPLGRCAFLLALKVIMRSNWTNAGPFRLNTIYAVPDSPGRTYHAANLGSQRNELGQFNALESSGESKYTCPSNTPRVTFWTLSKCAFLLSSEPKMCLICCVSLYLVFC